MIISANQHRLRLLHYLQIPLLLALIMLSFTSTEQPSIHLDKKKIDHRIEQIIQEYYAAGVSISIVKDNTVIYAKGFGYRDVEKKLKADEETLFCLGSCTKAFTASTLGILEDQRKLSLDDSPKRFIPQLEFYNEEMNNDISIHHMLSHSTGLSNLSTECSMVLFTPNSNQELIPRIQYLEPLHNVGERFMYSNYMYTMAALVGEAITDHEWKLNIKELIFNPLEMSSSKFGFNEAATSNNYSLGYAVSDEIPKKVIQDTIIGRGPAGSIFSSAMDMSNWMITWLNNGLFKSEQILPKSYIDKAQDQQISLPDSPEGIESRTSVGYGWFSEDFHGLKKVFHSGAISGYSTLVTLFPSEKIGITVLSNQSNSSLPNAITEMVQKEIFSSFTITNELRQRYTSSVIVEPAPKTMELNQSKLPSVDIEKYTGQYQRKGYGKFSVFIENENLYVKFPFTNFRLIHDEGDTFTSTYAEEIPTIMTPFLWFTFNNEAGKIIGLTSNMKENGAYFIKSE